MPTCSDLHLYWPSELTGRYKFWKYLLAFRLFAFTGQVNSQVGASFGNAYNVHVLAYKFADLLAK